MKLRIKKLDSSIISPNYVHEGDAAFDLRAGEEIVIKPGEKSIIGTKLIISIPKDYVGLIWDRSGLAAKNEITVLGGVIDSGYREEVKIILKNLGKESFVIKKNDRIAQMIIQPYLKAEIEEVSALEETDRKGGLGYTGIK